MDRSRSVSAAASRCFCGTLFELLNNSRFMGNILITAQRVAMAFLIRCAVLIAVGIYVGERVALYRAASPLLQLSLSIPQSILLPCFILALGIGSLQKVVFGITHIVFIVILNAVIAARSVPTGFSLVARSFGATTAETYLKFYLPAMVPYLMTGLRLGPRFPHDRGAPRGNVRSLRTASGSCSSCGANIPARTS